MAYSFHKAVHLQLKTSFGCQTADFGGKYYPQCRWKKKEKRKNMAAGQLFSLNLIRCHLDFGNWILGDSFSLQLKDIHRTKNCNMTN